MSSLLIAITAIAALCGPRVQPTASAGNRADAKQCQVEMLKCIKAKSTPVDESLASCIQEIK